MTKFQKFMLRMIFSDLFSNNHFKNLDDLFALIRSEWTTMFYEDSPCGTDFDMFESLSKSLANEEVLIKQIKERPENMFSTSLNCSKY